jgi:hypothetical protein
MTFMSKKKTTDRTLQAYLKPNHLCPEHGKYYAKVRTHKTMSISDICYQAITRGGTQMKPAAMEYAVREFLAEMTYQLTNGMAVNLEHMHISPSVKGTFKSPNDTFDNARHSLEYNFQEGPELRRAVSRTKVVVQGKKENLSGIQTLTDQASGTTDKLLTPKHIATIRGRNIKIVGDEREAGINLIDVESGECFRVPLTDIGCNQAQKVTFIVPDLPQGKYTLELHTLHTGGGRVSEKPIIHAYNHEALTVGE